MPACRGRVTLCTRLLGSVAGGRSAFYGRRQCGELHSVANSMHSIVTISCSAEQPRRGRGVGLITIHVHAQVAFPCRTSDETYLPALAAALEQAFKAFKPDFVLYNAGTDILVGDPLGACAPSHDDD